MLQHLGQIILLSTLHKGGPENNAENYEGLAVIHCLKKLRALYLIDLLYGIMVVVLYHNVILAFA